jgi:hypothetical protein
MAINIQNIIAALEAKVAAATSATETQELIVIIKSIKAAGQQTVVTYADVPNLPTANADNAGNLAYVAAVGKIYYSNGTTWTEVGSGAGGSSYDQDLNTTDDVVFNSALVGDVSIVGNEISGTDGYGNPDTLVVDGDLQVKFDSLTTETINESFGIQNPTLDPIFYASNVPTLEVRSKFVSGTIVTLTDNSFGNGTFVIQLTANLAYNDNYGNWLAPYTIISGGPISGNIVPASSVTITVASQTTPLSVTESGVNVDGTFTVNGQPVSGGSGFDGGSLVATDALIGDVSIVGNEISGIDGYGNDATLVVAAPVDFNFTGTTTSVVQTQISMGGVGFQTNMIGAFQIYDLFGNFQSEANQIVNLPQGTVITTNDMFSFATYQNTRFRFTIDYVQSSPDMYNPSVISAIYVYPIAQQFEYSTDGGQTWTTTSVFSYNFNRSNINLYLSFEAQVATSVVQTAVSVTESGLNVNGSFTVNGQPVSGSGSSYDQSLNTTDDVVFNSALIGDVTIVGNEISGTDGYGNPDTLVLNSPVEFKATETTSSETIIDFGASSAFVPVFDFGNYSQYVSLRKFSGFDQSAAQQLMAIPSGTLVTTNAFFYFNFMTYQNENAFFRFVVDGTPTSFNTNPYNPSSVTDIRYEVVSGTLESSTDGVNWTGQSFNNQFYQTTSSGVITYGDVTTIENTVLSVTGSGVNVDGNLTVTGSIINDSTLTVNANGSKSIIFEYSNIVAIDGYDESYYSGSNTIQLGNPGGAGFSYVAFPLSPSTANIIRNIKAGDAIRFTGNVTPYQTYERTVVSVEETTSEQQFLITFSGGDLDNTAAGSSEGAITLIEFGNSEYNFSKEGAFTTPNIIAETALLGDVSVVANTISAVDSYGNTDTLVVDGALDIKNVSSISTNYSYSSPPVVGQRDGTLYWNGTSITWMNPSGVTLDIIASLKAGDTITFEDGMNGGTYITVTLTSTMVYSMGAMGYTATVVENNSTGMSINASNNPITITSLVTKTSSFDSTGLTVDGDLSITGALNGYQPIGITNIALDDTNVTSMILVNEVKSALYIGKAGTYAGTDAVSIVLPTALEGQRITIFNGSPDNTCTIMNAYPLAGSPPAPAAMAPQSTLTVIHLTGGNWFVC